jgi:hypothetical protein
MRPLTVRSASLLRVAVVALAAHAIVYRSFVPADGVHRYMGWYTPLLGALSAAALLVAGAVAIARSTGLATSLIPDALAVPTPTGGASHAASRLAARAIGFLVLQETLERSIPARSLVLVQFTPLQWLTVLCATACVAFVLISAGRGCRLLGRCFRARRSAAIAAIRSRCLAPRSVALVAWPPLASFSGLRAPPAPACV